KEGHEALVCDTRTLTSNDDSGSGKRVVPIARRTLSFCCCGNDDCPTCGQQNAAILARTIAVVMQPRLFAVVSPVDADFDVTRERMKTVTKAIRRKGRPARLIWNIERGKKRGHLHIQVLVRDDLPTD